MGDATVLSACLSCGQQLVVPTADLAVAVECPRCQANHQVATLVSQTTPLPARVVASGPVELASPSEVALTGSDDLVPPPRHALVRGAVAAHSLGSWLAERAVDVDAALARRRGAVLFVGAVITNVSLLVSLTLYAVVLPLYALLLWVVLVARLWSFRDDEGRWTAAGAAVRVGAVAAALTDGVRSLVDGAWSEGLRRVGTGLLGAAVITATVAAPTSRVCHALSLIGAAQTLDAVAIAAWLVALAGGVLFAIGWDAQRRSCATFRAAGPISALELSPALDLRRDGVPRSAPPQLKPLLAALRDWSPRSPPVVSGSRREKAYQKSLLRHLNQRFPDALVEKEFQLRLDRSVIAREDVKRSVRFDILFQRSVVLELKVSLRGRTGEDAMGQVRKYAKVWREGPILVVSCESSENFAESDAARSFETLRRDGMNVAVVAAGRLPTV